MKDKSRLLAWMTLTIISKVCARCRIVGPVALRAITGIAHRSLIAHIGVGVVPAVIATIVIAVVVAQSQRGARNHSGGYARSISATPTTSRTPSGEMSSATSPSETTAMKTAAAMEATTAMKAAAAPAVPSTCERGRGRKRKHQTGCAYNFKLCHIAILHKSERAMENEQPDGVNVPASPDVSAGISQ